MNKTILFFLALMLITTTACGRGNSNNNPVKEETMTTEGNGKVIHLTKADFLAKVYNFEKNPKEWKYEGVCSGLIPAERFRMAPHTLWLFSAEVHLYAPRIKMPLERSVFLTDSRNSAPEPAAACARGKRRSRHTGKACCGSPAARDTARWAPVPAAPAPAGKAQSPCRRAEWGT